jgi:hypothetical protein
MVQRSPFFTQSVALMRIPPVVLAGDDHIAGAGLVSVC